MIYNLVIHYHSRTVFNYTKQFRMSGRSWFFTIAPGGKSNRFLHPHLVWILSFLGACGVGTLLIGNLNDHLGIDCQ